MRAIAVTVASLTVLMLVASSARGSTSPACWVACSYRHPVARWKLDHHLARCQSAHCEEKRARTGPRDSRTGPPTEQAYPCIVRWTFDAARWWHLRYGPQGPYGRNHIGYGPTSYRRCL